jgi:hypothetical protein
VTARLVSDRPAAGGAGCLGEYLYLVSFVIPEARWHDLDAWYEQEHVTLLLEVPGWLRCRRYQVTAGGQHLSLAAHELSDSRALAAPERDLAVRTAWRDRLAAEDWFASKRSGLYWRDDGARR